MAILVLISVACLILNLMILFVVLRILNGNDYDKR